MTDGDGDTALDEAELGVHLVERGCADYILAPGDTFLALSGNLPLIFRRRRAEEDAIAFELLEMRREVYWSNRRNNEHRDSPSHPS